MIIMSGNIEQLCRLQDVAAVEGRVHGSRQHHHHLMGDSMITWSEMAQFEHMCRNRMSPRRP